MALFWQLAVECSESLRLKMNQKKITQVLCLFWLAFWLLRVGA
jgi:hypothetical protein